MEKRDRTAVQVKGNTWNRLNRRKEGAWDSFDDIITRLLDNDDALDKHEVAEDQLSAVLSNKERMKKVYYEKEVV